MSKRQTRRRPDRASSAGGPVADGGQHRIVVVRRIAVEVDAGDDAVEQPAGEDRHARGAAPAACRRASARRPAGGCASTTSPSASGRAAGERAAVLPRLDDRVGHRRAVAVDDRAADRERVGIVGAAPAWPAPGRRGRGGGTGRRSATASAQPPPGSSNGVAAGPRTTMSNRKPSAHAGSRHVVVVAGDEALAGGRVGDRRRGSGPGRTTDRRGSTSASRGAG